MKKSLFTLLIVTILVVLPIVTIVQAQPGKAVSMEYNYTFTCVFVSGYITDTSDVITRIGPTEFSGNIKYTGISYTYSSPLTGGGMDTFLSTLNGTLKVGSTDIPLSVKPSDSSNPSTFTSGENDVFYTWNYQQDVDVQVGDNNGTGELRWWGRNTKDTASNKTYAVLIWTTGTGAEKLTYTVDGFGAYNSTPLESPECRNVAGIVASAGVPTGAANEYSFNLQITSSTIPGVALGQWVWCAATTTDFPSLLTTGIALNGNLDNSRGWWVLGACTVEPTECRNVAGIVASAGVPTGAANEYSFNLQITSSTVPGVTLGQWVWCAATTTDFLSLLTMSSVLNGNLDNSRGWWVLSACALESPECGNVAGKVASAGVPTGAANEYSFNLQITSSTVPGVTVGQRVWCAATTTDFSSLLTMSSVLNGNLDNSRGWWVLSACTTIPNKSPVFDALITDMNIPTGHLVTLNFPAAYNADNDPLTYSVGNLPPGANFDASTRVFSWMPNAAGTYNGIVFSLTGGKSLPYSWIISITVIDPAMFTGNIVFYSAFEGNNETYVLDTGGTNRTRLINNIADDVYPEWFPDDIKFAFSSNRAWDLFIRTIHEPSLVAAI